MSDSEALQPGDLSAAEMIRLHDELEGDPTSSAHREAWNRWHEWTAGLTGSGDADEADRAARIEAYIDETFPPPEASSTTKAAGIAGAGAVAAVAGYEAGQATSAGAAEEAGTPAASEVGHGASAGSGTHGAGAHGAGAHGAGATEVAAHGGDPAGTAGTPALQGGAGAQGAASTTRTATSGSHLGWVVAVVLVVAVAGIGGFALSRSHSPSTTLPPTTSATTPRAHDAAFECKGSAIELFNNTNGGAVTNGGTPPSFSTKGAAYCVSSVDTYHWNNGAGAAPGTIALARTAGPTGEGGSMAPTKAVGSAGQGGAPNVNWGVTLSTSRDPVVIDGTYTCESSDPGTWSADPTSSGHGFCEVYGVPAAGS